MKQIALFAIAVCFCLLGCDKSPSANNDWKRVGGQGMVQFVVVSKDKESDQSVYDAAIASLCHEDKFCFLWFWSDPESAATGIPMSDAALQAETAIYNHNPTNGLTELLWACRIKPGSNKCFNNDVDKKPTVALIPVTNATNGALTLDAFLTTEFANQYGITKKEGRPLKNGLFNNTLAVSGQRMISLDVTTKGPNIIYVGVTFQAETSFDDNDKTIFVLNLFRALDPSTARLHGISGGISKGLNKRVSMIDLTPARTYGRLQVRTGTVAGEAKISVYLDARVAAQNAASAAQAMAAERAAVASPGSANLTSKWDYSDSVDNMSGTTSHYASLKTDNILHFDQPYGDLTANLVLVRDTDGKVNAWISVKAQFSSYYPNGVVRVKFDNDKVQWWSCHEILGAPLGTLYIDGERRFIKRLTKAKKLFVEARFYPSNYQQMEFNVAGLEWK